MANRRIIVEIGSKKASFCITSQRHGKQLDVIRKKVCVLDLELIDVNR